MHSIIHALLNKTKRVVIAHLVTRCSILFVSDICFYLNMKYALKRDVVWLESLPIVDHFATIILTGDDGHLVEVTASLLLAVSPLMRSILSEHLPPAYSQCFLSLPSATEEVLKDVRNILTGG